MSVFTGRNIVVTGGYFNINDPQIATRVILQAFGNNYVPTATHDNNDVLDAPKCHSGTRTSFLRDLSAWVRDTESSVYLTWLHGPAGAGKSAIARSLAESLHRDGLLAGSFFFFRTDLRRNSEKSFVMTLAYQIARSVPATRLYIARAVDDDPTVCSLSLGTQFEKLIIKPLDQVAEDELKPLRPMLIIVDGLDECADHTARHLILELVFDAHQRLHRHNVKFLVVSRPEYDIQRSFDSFAARRGDCIDTIELQENLQAYEDVRLYLRDNFHRIKQSHPLREHFPPDWPSEDAIERLVEKSSGHFIYAKTVIKYVEHDFDQPQRRLDIIVNLRATSQKPYAILDSLYLNILSCARADRTLLLNILSITLLDGQFDKKLSLDKGFMKLLRFIQSVLFLQPGEVELALLDLKSLMGARRSIEFWHRSFTDFLLDPSRSNEFYAHSGHACAVIAKGCLRLLSDKTFLLERSWSDFAPVNLTIECHHLLSLCCKNAVVDHDLQAAMMKYEFNVIPSDRTTSIGYFSVLYNCLLNHKHATIFKGTKVVERLLPQFDDYLISDLRYWVRPDSEIMDALRATISPSSIYFRTYRALTSKKSWPNVKSSCFLYFMHSQDESEGDILYDFFYSKDRAAEYYLGPCSTSLSVMFEAWTNSYTSVPTGPSISFTPSGEDDENVSKPTSKRKKRDQTGQRKRKRQRLGSLPSPVRSP